MIRSQIAPSAIVHAFTEALRSIKGDQRIKYTILKELNQTSLGDINAIYADLNRHLEGLRSSGDGLSDVPETEQSDGLFRELAMDALGRAGRVGPLALS